MHRLHWSHIDGINSDAICDGQQISSRYSACEQIFQVQLSKVKTISVSLRWILAQKYRLTAVCAGTNCSGEIDYAFGMIASAFEVIEADVQF